MNSTTDLSSGLTQSIALFKLIKHKCIDSELSCNQLIEMRHHPIDLAEVDKVIYQLLVNNNDVRETVTLIKNIVIPERSNNSNEQRWDDILINITHCCYSIGYEVHQHQEMTGVGKRDLDIIMDDSRELLMLTSIQARNLKRMLTELKQANITEGLD